MPIFDEEAPKKNPAHALGEDLSRLSLHELEARVALLRRRALVDVEEPELVRQRVEPGPEHRVVEPRPTVQDEQREPVAELLDEERDPVGRACRDPTSVHSTARSVGRGPGA